jgi:hypothetical protein
MCLTAEALALFLNLLSADIVTTEPGRVIVHSGTGDVHWEERAAQWCTTAPQSEPSARDAR